MENGKKMLLNIMSFPKVVIGNLNRWVINKDEIPDYKSRGRQHFIKAFTLIELLVVVLIIGILSAIALPQYQKIIEKTKATQALSLLKTAYQAQQSYFLTNGIYATDFNTLAIDIPWTDTTRWMSSAQDARANEEWSLNLFSNTVSSYLFIGRLTGPYAGGGFGYFLLQSNAGDLPVNQLVCLERKARGVIFQGNAGSYCQKIFSGKLIYEDSGVRAYEIF